MRYSKKIAAKIAVLLRKILDIFLAEKRGKEKQVVISTSAFRVSLWLIAFATIVLIEFMRKIGLTYLPIFLILWIGNMVLSGGFVWANKETKVDFTSMEGLRNILQKAFEKSKIVGYLAEIGMFFFLLIWEGPEQFVIFFEKRFSSKGMMILVFVLASCCFITIWTHVFMGLADGFWDLISKLY